MNKRYIVVLRAINVGGNNIIKMTDLQKCFESNGYKNVKTYIQSGNLAFDSVSITDIANEEIKIEKFLSENFNYQSAVVLIEQAIVAQIFNQAPFDMTLQNNAKRYFIFLKYGIDAQSLIDSFELNPDIDKAYSGYRVIYFESNLQSNNKSFLDKFSSTKISKQTTIRNFNTVQKIKEL